MSNISSLKARQILDSRGNPTIEVDCILDDGNIGRAAVPSGASTGKYEAIELRDADPKLFDGKSVMKAVKHVEGAITKALKNFSVSDQRTLDQKLIDLDGTANKSKLGANAILGVSMAACRARAAKEKKSLWQSLAEQFDVPMKGKVRMPVPMMNVINGGVHAESGLSFQEFMIVPNKFPTYKDALRAGAEIFYVLKRLLKKANLVTMVGDEGGFAPHVHDARQALSLLITAIDSAGYTGRVHLALDAAASEFTEKGKYTVDGKVMDAKGLTDYYADLTSQYPIVSIEDSQAEEDWDGFALMQKRLGEKIQLVGDDLFVTNTERIKEGIKREAANAVLIKLNQIGTVSETVDAIELARKNNWRTIVSHRSGETEDTFIAHLAVGLQTGQIKTGSLSRGERTCKYNELLRIEEELGDKAEYVSPF